MAQPDCSFVSSGRPYASAAFRVGLDALSLYLCPFVAIIVWSFAEVNTSRTHHAAKGWNHGTLTQKTQKLPFFLIRISSQKTYMHNICIICICIVYVVIHKYSSIQWFHIHNTGSRQICSRFEGRFALLLFLSLCLAKPIASWLPTFPVEMGNKGFMKWSLTNDWIVDHVGWVCTDNFFLNHQRL